MDRQSNFSVHGQGRPSSTEVSLTAGGAGVVSLQATQHIQIQQYFNTFKYSRQLSKVVKMHVQIYGMTVELPSGRDLLN